MLRWKYKKNVLIRSSVLFLLLISSIYFYKSKERVNSESYSCRTSELGLPEVKNFSFRDISSSAPCHSKLLHENEREIIKEMRRLGRSGGIRTSSKQNTTDILVFIVESLSIKKFREEMSATHISLNKAEIVWFSSFHHRKGTTRANIGPLLIGQPLYRSRLDPRSKQPGKGEEKEAGIKRSSGIPYFLINRPGNYSTIIDVPKNFVSSNALWNIAKRHGYHTLHGSTACNMFMGLHRVSTKNSRIVYDHWNSRLSEFDSSFPLGAYYTKEKKKCKAWPSQWDSQNPEGMLKCNSQGPYHHKFLDYYIKFKGLNLTRPLLTITQLYETHGSKIFWPLDFHVSQYFDWLLEKQDTLILFMGDHGDETGTPLGMVLPRALREGREELRKLSHGLVVSENIYEFLKAYIETQSIMKSINALKREMFHKDCDSYQDLEVCLCEKSMSKNEEIIFSASFVDAAVTHVRARSRIGCFEYILEKYDNVKHGYRSLSFDLFFESGVIFEVTLRSMDDFHVAQRTRYASQASCVPDAVHPEFCLCNTTLFEMDNFGSSHILQATKK